MSDMDRELDRLFREMRDEALPEGVLEAARSGARARIAAGKRQRSVWTWLSLAAAAAALWFAVIFIREPQLARLPVVALRTPAVPEAEFQRGVAGLAHSRVAGGSPGQERGDAGMLRADASVRHAPLRNPAVAGSGSAREAPPTAEPKTGETQFIRMMTDDPNVVILWALNSKGETR